MFPRRQNIRPAIFGTLVFLGALLLLVNGTIIYSIRTSQRLLDEELGKRLQATAHIAALLVRPEQFDLLSLAVVDSANADSAGADFITQMDAQEASDAIKAEWARLAQSAGLSNVDLVDRGRRVLLRLREPYAFEPDVATLDPAPLARALIGEISRSSLYYKDGQYLRSAYAPVIGSEGSVVGAVVVEGGSEAFSPLQLIRTSLYGVAAFASLLVILIWLGYVRTVGQLTRIEENLRHTDLLASIGQVSAGVAHEIRNPLAVLRGASGRLAKFDQLGSEQRAQLLSMIDEEVNRMSDFVQNFLTLSKRPNPEPQVFELRPVLDRSLEILRVEMDRAGIGTTLDWQAGNGVSLLGDPLAMHHVFLNLALNARDVMSQGGRLVVRVLEHRGEVRIQFEDTGPGVPRELRKKIFDAFFTTRADGTGLGLAFVDRIVSEHGGSVTVKDAPTRGAVFEIRLPLESE
jgi:signal transduction histidine kinase